MQETISNKKKNQPPPEKEMSFWEHLEELRGHIFRSLAVILVFAIAAFIAKKYIFDYVILAPKDADFLTNRLLCKLGDLLSVEALCIGRMDLNIQNINMSGQFMTHMYVSLFAGLIVAAPYVIWELWRFIMPALHPKEKKYSQGAVFVSSLLFLLGVLFAYFLIVPLTINFLGTYQVSEDVPNQIQLNSFISTIISVTIAVGIVFELPILVFFLTKVGLVTPAFLKKNRKYMLVIVLIISAIITPPDVFSQILVCIPLLGLYEISISIAKRVYKKRESNLAG
ncbi:MAG: twin-arginine translocase subunit TatC [Bacteroidales bacterium]|nr:twin-arginine translocase subunit TatC [Bacteroidales bacterium]